VEAWLRCGPLAPRHTIVAGRPIVRDGGLCALGVEEMLSRHAAIARTWQGIA
jgi:8-oxoguanine deaminase